MADYTIGGNFQLHRRTLYYKKRKRNLGLKKKWFFPVSITVFVLVFIYLLIPYFMIHNLTKKYGSEFTELYRENGFYNDIEYLKIIQYRDEKADFYYSDNDKIKKELDSLDNDYAVVLYVEENHNSASLFIFSDEDGQWKLSNWHLIWSYSGTADGFLWPYYF